MISDEEFRGYYERELVKHIEPLEKYRAERLVKLKRRLWSTIILFILTIGLFYTRTPWIIAINFLIFTVFFGATRGVYYETLKVLRRKYKEIAVQGIIKHLYSNSQYIPNQRIAKSVLVKSMIFPSYITNSVGEDFMQFTIGKSIVMFCETTVYKTGERIMFRGVFISSSFNKYFKSKLFLITKKPISYLTKIKRQLLNKLQTIDVENSDLEKEFYIIGEDQVESRYILSTSLMARLVDYKRKINKNISFSFSQNRMYCTIPNFINLFEPPIFTPIDYECLKKSYDPIKDYTDLVEDLNLNMRIWSKQ